MHAMATNCLLLLAATSLFPGSLATDVEWYISPNGSADVATCGHSPDIPCNSLQTVLTQSRQFNETAPCYLSSGATDGRDSTTIYFMGEENLVPPVCLMNWVNVRVVGLGNRTTIVSRPFGAQRGIFEFISSANVSIENLSFATSAIGRAILFFQACRDIRVVDSLFLINATSSQGVQLLQCAGDISLSGNLFYGDPSKDSSRLHPLGLDVTHGCSDCTLPFTEIPYNFSTLSFSLEITRCVFQDISNEGPPRDSYGSSRTGAVAMRLQFREESVGNRIAVVDTTFKRISNSESNGVLVNYEGRTENHTVLFEDCTFQENRVRYGGGVAAYFYSNPSNNLLEIRGCTFMDNTADFEGGGVFAVYLSSGMDNSVVISNSSFIRNTAQSGSGIFLLNNPSWFMQRGAFDPISFTLVGAELRDCVFQSNVASSLSQGVVGVLRIKLNISGVR